MFRLQAGFERLSRRASNCLILQIVPCWDRVHKERMSKYCCVCCDVPELVWMIRTGTEVCWNKNVINCI